MATETYQLGIEGILEGSYRETTLHFSGVGVSTGDTLAAGESLIAGFVAAAETLFLARLPDQYYLRRYTARRVTPKPSATAVTQYQSDQVSGALAMDPCAQQLNPVIFLVPTMGTKSGGKIFWPAVATGDLIDSAYQAAFMTAVDSFIAAIIAGFTNGGITWTLCIYSRKTGGVSTVSGHNYSPVIGFQSKRRRPVGGV